MKSILMLSHFHIDYPFNLNSSWMKVSHAGDVNFQNPQLTEFSINTSLAEDRIQKYQKYYPDVSEKDFLKAMGQQATEYWLWKNCDADYIGCTTYRRYLLIEGAQPEDVDTAKIVYPTNPQHIYFLSSDIQKEKTLDILEEYDIITNTRSIIPWSVEHQYLASEPKEYWDLFIDGIRELFPEYNKALEWFQGNYVNYETTYIMRKEYFKKYASEYFALMEYVWQKTDNTFPTHEYLVQNNKTVGWWNPQGHPWRYPGFLGERFFPFFVYANNMKAHYVPLVLFT
jgi:hypothetical protein